MKNIQYKVIARFALLIPIMALLSSCGSNPVYDDMDPFAEAPLANALGDPKDYWVAVRHEMKYPRGAYGKGTIGCVNAAFVINSDGTTSHFRVLKVFPEDNVHFPYAASQTIEDALYEPGPANPGRLPYTVVESFSYSAWQTRREKVLIDQAFKKVHEDCKLDSDKAVQLLKDNGFTNIL